LTSRDPASLPPRSGLERLCFGLAGRGDPPLDADLRARVRHSAGLVTHPAAVTRDFTSAVEALTRAGARLAALFGPEHGVRGEAPDGRAVACGVDAHSGLPVYSLYRGGSSGSHSPTPEMLRGIDVLIVDLQDIGARFYTFASTVSHCMEAAAAAGVPLVILDRPNPIGDAIEGPLLERKLASFVGLHPLPIRHGCTMGELALLFHRAFGVGDEPAVVPFGDDRRQATGDRRDRGDIAGPVARRLSPVAWDWVPPSPNIPTPLTALVYPGTCLLEGTNVSEGRGTAKPFEWLGAPWIDAGALAERLRAAALPGAGFRPVYFIPSASKWAGECCAGVQLHVTDDRAFRPVLTGIAILAALRAMWPEQFQWRESGGGYAVDRLAGTEAVRRAIDAGEVPVDIAASWSNDERAFRSTRATVRIYR
jgi:uncharacterized protein YbbC (DUF1343 family)